MLYVRSTWLEHSARRHHYHLAGDPGAGQAELQVSKPCPQRSLRRGVGRSTGRSPADKGLGKGTDKVPSSGFASG